MIGVVRWAAFSTLLGALALLGGCVATGDPIGPALSSELIQVMQSAAPADRAPDHVAAFDRLALVLEHRGFQPNDPSTMASEFRFDRSKLPPADREAYFSFGSAPPVIVRLAHQENTRNRSVLTADVIWFATPDGEEVQRALANDTSDLIQVWWAKYRRDRSQEQ